MAIQALKRRSAESRLPVMIGISQSKLFCEKYSMSRTRLYELIAYPWFPGIRIGRSDEYRSRPRTMADGAGRKERPNDLRHNHLRAAPTLRQPGMTVRKG
jgi:hypothetical protein